MSPILTPTPVEVSLSTTSISSSNGSAKASKVKLPLTSEETREKVLLPYTYVSGMKGKNIRKKFTRSFNTWFEVPEHKLCKWEKIVYLLHNASLVLDDIEDGSDIRRGLPAAHIKYGVPLAMNAGTYVLFLAQRILLEFNDIELATVVTDGILSAHEGQGIEIYWRDNLNSSNILTDAPTLHDYENIICKKTSMMFGLCMEFGKRYSTKEDIKTGDYVKLGDYIGAYFQIRDDFFNVTHETYTELKGYAEDVTEGKISYPVLVTLNSNAPDDVKLRLWDILEKRTSDMELKKEAVEILKTTGALGQCRKRLDELHTEMFNEIEILGLAENEELMSFFIDNLWLD